MMRVGGQEGECSMNAGIGGATEQLAEGLGWIALLLVVTTLMVIFGIAGAFRLDDTLHDPHLWRKATLPGVEFVIVPLAAIAAARWRVGADRLIALRASRIGPGLGLLMAAALVGLVAYLHWSWSSALTTTGPAPEFGLVRWLGTALAAAFTVVWLPLFPRITATLAGMIAGPALFAMIGYTFFGSHMQLASPGSDGLAGVAGGLGLLAAFFWLLGVICLSYLGRRGDLVRQDRPPLSYAVWSGALMLFLAVRGITF